MIDPGGVEAASPALDAEDHIVPSQHHLSQITAILAGDAVD